MEQDATGCDNGNTSSLSEKATDGSGYSLAATYTTHTITTKSGQVLNPPVNLTSGYSSGSYSATDSNGNQISVTNTSNTATFIDTLGQTALTISGTSPVTFAYTAPSGAQAQYTMNYVQYTVRTNFGISGTNEYGPLSNALVDNIQLPDGTKYILTYEKTIGTCTPLSGTYSANCVTGRIASVTLPTGGTITYEYSGGSGSSGIYGDGSTAVLTRILAASNTCTGPCWQYTRALVTGSPGPGSKWTTTVADPSGNNTVINFSEDGNTTKPTYSLYETQRQVYQGSISANNLLLTTTNCFNANYVNCSSASVSSPLTQTDRYAQPAGGSNRLAESVFNSYGLVTDNKEYDYGVTTGSAPGISKLMRETATTYATLGNGIVSSPSSVKVYDWTSGSQVLASSTTYGYDETSVTGTSGTPQHLSVTGSRGNVTTVTTSTSSTATLVRRFTYFDTGTPNVATDVNGAQTTYVYGSGSCGNSFATGNHLPLGLGVSMTWNCIGGVMTSSTDPNTGVVSTSYNDPHYWLHASNVTDQSLNVTNLIYSNTATAESVLSFNANQSAADVETTLDSMGRPQLAQTRQSPGSNQFDTIETDYDFMGRVVRTTLPYVATANQTSASAPATTTQYDALGRVVQVSDSGGGVVLRTYTQNDVLRTVSPAPTGENTKRKQLEYDGLNRLTSVCEITTATGSGTCGQTSSKTGYWTKYTHNSLGKIIGVTQNAQSTSTQTRAFSFDMLGRLTSETNPETGTTTYTYDSASGCTGVSNGDVIKRVDAVSNATCYGYDALHRVTSITYSGSYAPNTPNKYFVYDAATVNGSSMTKTNGRLTEAYTATCSTCSKITDVGFSYSATGKITDVYESTPHSSGYYHLTATYWANGNLDVLSGLPGLPTLTYGIDGEGRGYSVTASSGQNPVTSTLYNASDKPTAITFGSNDSDGFSYDPNTGRLTQYKFNINGQSLLGNLTWNANQSLQKLSITDPFNSSNAQTCTYAFDDLRRIASTNCGSTWAQTFSYDPFGNISKTGSSSFQPTYSTTTNRMTALPGFTPSYDANGNLLSDSLHSYTWDVDGHTVVIDSVNLTFDALGRMVEHNRSGAYTQIVYS